MSYKLPIMDGKRRRMTQVSRRVQRSKDLLAIWSKSFNLFSNCSLISINSIWRLNNSTNLTLKKRAH